MEKYVGFLRGLNVGGQKLVNLDDLNRSFAALGFQNVKTLIQTGNVIFEPPELPEADLVNQISRKLEKDLEFAAPLILKNMQEINAMVLSNPFKGVKPGADVKKYVVFLAGEPKFNPPLPMKSGKKDLEIFAVSRRVVYCLAFPAGNGRYGFPNAWVESEFGVPATSRTWDTLLQLAQA